MYSHWLEFLIQYSKELFLSVAGGRTHIGTYVGVSPSPASNENNKIKNHKIFFVIFYFVHFTSFSVLNFVICYAKIKLVCTFTSFSVLNFLNFLRK